MESHGSIALMVLKFLVSSGCHKSAEAFRSESRLDMETMQGGTLLPDLRDVVKVNTTDEP